MPKVIKFTPAWLSNGSPGHNIFTETQEASKRSSVIGKPVVRETGKTSKPGPKRTIAHRGTEVFVAVGKEIRWADLVYLKQKHEDDHLGGSGREWEEKTEDQAHGCRVRNVTADLNNLLNSL